MLPLFECDRNVLFAAGSLSNMFGQTTCAKAPRRERHIEEANGR
jgi:hypothetical protein